MILKKEYLRERAVAYARKYALVRNPLFYTFEGIGGNCTNFVSQSVLAGSCVMNFIPIYGWFYLSSNRRAPAWTGVQFFYNFMVNNLDVGPYGSVVPIEQAQIGDVIQLQNNDDVYYHTLIITEIRDGEILICANSVDSLDRPLSTYEYKSLRVIHIEGVRYDTRYVVDCFESLYDPPLPPITPPSEQTPSNEEVPPPNGESIEEQTPSETGEEE